MSQAEADLRALEPEAHLLDKYYVPTRCPNGLAAPAIPATFYTSEDAQSCFIIS